MKPLVFSILIAAALIGGAFFVTGGAAPDGRDAATNNVTIENGTQVIAITASGGYLPRSTSAKAGMPTVIRMHSAGSFDCSSYVVIPDAKFQGSLPQSGLTVDIPLPPQKKGAVMRGFCGMGMYNFSIRFD